MSQNPPPLVIVILMIVYFFIGLLVGAFAGWIGCGPSLSAGFAAVSVFVVSLLIDAAS